METIYNRTRRGTLYNRAFTPDEDDINDLFYAKGYGIIEFEMLIFDWWGNLIF